MNTEILVATAVGALIGSATSGVYKYLFDTKRVTVDDCEKRHKAESSQCAECKKELKDESCAIRHGMSDLKGLMLLIAVKIGVPNEELKMLVEHHER